MNKISGVTRDPKLWEDATEKLGPHTESSDGVYTSFNKPSRLCENPSSSLKMLAITALFTSSGIPCGVQKWYHRA